MPEDSIKILPISLGVVARQQRNSKYLGEFIIKRGSGETIDVRLIVDRQAGVILVTIVPIYFHSMLEQPRQADNPYLVLDTGPIQPLGSSAASEISAPNWAPICRSPVSVLSKNRVAVNCSLRAPFQQEGGTFKYCLLNSIPSDGRGSKRLNKLISILIAEINNNEDGRDSQTTGSSRFKKQLQDEPINSTRECSPVLHS